MEQDVVSFANATLLGHCPACMGNHIKPYLVGSDFHYGIVGTYATDRCDDCGTVFMNPMPGADELKSFYPDDYYSYQPPVPESLLRRIGRTVFRYPRVYTVPHFDHPGTMVDIGCGAGHYLLEMRRLGWSVYGAELSNGAADAGRQAGLDIRGGELTDAGFDEQMFDFVRSNHSLEHIPNPDVILQEIRRIMKDSGKLFIGIPSYSGLWATIFKKYWWNFGLPVHTFNYTINGIKSVLDRNGFDVEKVVFNSDYSGLLGSLQIQRNARRGISSSQGGLMSSYLLRGPAHYLSKLLDIFHKGDCIEVIATKRR